MARIAAMREYRSSHNEMLVTGGHGAGGRVKADGTSSSKLDKSAISTSQPSRQSQVPGLF